jgi:glycine/sarcosine N-methyltransferase
MTPSCRVGIAHLGADITFDGGQCPPHGLAHGSARKRRRAWRRLDLRSDPLAAAASPPDGASRSPGDLFASARWYDLGVNWEMRLARELPVFRDVFGPPGKLGLLDVACGTGRHVAALAQAGYRVIGLDCSADMLALGREHLSASGLHARLIEASFDAIPPDLGQFDGVLCIGNSLAAAGSSEVAERAVAAMARSLRPGGRLFIQVLNFERLRTERPAVRGPRARTEDGIEYLTTRLFTFAGDAIQVTSLTLWNDGGWKKHAASATLVPISQPELTLWCESAGLMITALWGGYDRQPFDAAASEDLILLATA